MLVGTMYNQLLALVLYLSLLLSKNVCFFFFFFVEDKRFKPDIRVVHVRDLNFVLQLVIFVNFDRQLWASHLILGCTLIYSTWQPFGQALLVVVPCYRTLKCAI